MPTTTFYSPKSMLIQDKSGLVIKFYLKETMVEAEIE